MKTKANTLIQAVRMAIRRTPPIYNMNHVRPLLERFAAHIAYTEHAPWESMRSLVEHGEVEVVDDGGGGRRMKTWRNVAVGAEQSSLELAPPRDRSVADVGDSRRAKPGEVTGAVALAARAVGAGGAGFTSGEVDDHLGPTPVRGLSSTSSSLAILERRGVVRRAGRRGRSQVWVLAERTPEPSAESARV